MRIEIGSCQDLNSTLPGRTKTEARACGRGLQSGAALDSGERFSQVPLCQLDTRDSTRCPMRAPFSGQIDEPVNVDVRVGGDHLGLALREAGAEKGVAAPLAHGLISDDVLYLSAQLVPLCSRALGCLMIHPRRLLWPAPAT